MIDTRIAGRDEPLVVTDPALHDPDRTMLGEPQKEWLFDRLSSSQARWKIIGNQVIFSEFNVGWAGALIGQTYDDAENSFMDIWDGYPAERRQIVDYLREEEIDNVVILTGDFHTSMAFEVADPPVELKFRELDGFGTVPEYLATDYDPETGEGAIAVEFVSPSVASGNFDESTSLAIALALQGQLNTDIRPNDKVSLGNPNPHLKYVDLTRHGYYLLDVTEQRVQADYFYTPVLERTSTEAFDVGLSSPAGGHHLTLTDTPAPGKTVQDVPAPADPPALINAVRAPVSVVVLSVYPNPAVADLQLQYALRRAGRVTVTLLDGGGRQLRTLQDTEQPPGLYTLETGVADLPSGAYRLRIVAEGSVSTQAFVKR
jgi:alkaline phosphatase D